MSESIRAYKRLKNTLLHNQLVEVLEIHEKMKGCYFWRSPRNAKQRRALETANTHFIAFRFQDSLYELDQETSVSTKNVYYSLSVKVDGVKKDVRVLRSLVGRVTQ